MIRYRNECVDCRDGGFPCYGSSCPNRHVAYYICDRCDTEIYGKVFHEDDYEDLCEDCHKKILEENCD